MERGARPTLHDCVGARRPRQRHRGFPPAAELGRRARASPSRPPPHTEETRSPTTSSGAWPTFGRCSPEQGARARGFVLGLWGRPPLPGRGRRATSAVENSVLGRLNRACAQPRLQAAAAGAGREGHGEARAGEGAGVLGGTTLQSSGDFLLVGRRGRSQETSENIGNMGKWRSLSCLAGWW